MLRSLQTLGAAWLYTRRALTLLVDSDWRSSELDERSWRVRVYLTTDDAKYAGQPVSRTLSDIVGTLKSDR